MLPIGDLARTQLIADWSCDHSYHWPFEASYSAAHHSMYEFSVML